MALKLLKYSVGKGPLKLLLERLRTCKLEKESLTVGPFKEPWSLFDLRYNNLQLWKHF
jgi:hypothetical protein